MTVNTPQFTLWSHKGGPNPWKVVIVLEELNLPYKAIYVDSANMEHKKEPFISLNPNGRVPALIDHSNNDFTVWESGAILLYLIGKYDTEHKLSFADFESTTLANQYLMFQMSGQGPYFGQAYWFLKNHPEKIPSAINRYIDEIKRVLGVLENILKDKEFLVGDRVSYADISFVPWNWLLALLPEVSGWEKEFPKMAAWDRKLNEIPSVKKAREIREEALKG